MIRDVARQIRQTANFIDYYFYASDNIPEDVRKYWLDETVRRRAFEKGMFSYGKNHAEAVIKEIKNKKRHWPLKYLTIDGIDLEYSNSEAINQFLPDGYVYHFGHGYGGKPIFLLGKCEKVEQFEKVKIHTISKELVCNERSSVLGEFDYEYNVALCRKQPAKFLLERNIFQARKNQNDPMVNIVIDMIEELSGHPFKSFGNKNRPPLDDAIQSVAGFTKAHELGHYEGSKHFGFEKLKEISKLLTNSEAESFFITFIECIADSIERQRNVGMINYALQSARPRGLLALKMSNNINKFRANQDDIMVIMERDLFPAYESFLESGDLSHIRDANRQILSRSVSIARKMNRFSPQTISGTNEYLLKLQKKELGSAEKDRYKTKKSVKRILSHKPQKHL